MIIAKRMQAILGWFGKLPYIHHLEVSSVGFANSVKNFSLKQGLQPSRLFLELGYSIHQDVVQS